jgi:emfourin
MHTRFISVAIASIALAACAHRDPTSTTPGAGSADFGTLNAAKLVLVAEGGIAALHVKYSVDHDTRTYAYSQRHICTVNCGAPLDTASGTLSAAAADSLFSLVWAQAPYALHDDYGTTPQAADMMTYTLSVTFEGNTKTIRADDGTMPEAMRKMVDATRGIVAAARSK